jgi:hypothetical protein
MKVKIVKNFIPKSQLKELNDWTLNNYKSSFFTDANMGRPNTRLTTRYFSKENNFNYPELVYCIKNKIIDYFDIKNEYISPPVGKDSIVNGIGFDGGDIFERTDPIWFSNTYTIHCNILSQKSLKGGVTIIENKNYDINEGDLLIYNVSHLNHKVTLIEGEIPRILWVFAFSVEENIMKKIFNSKTLNLNYQ